MFRKYIERRGPRSLARLAEIEGSPSLSTLKRWSIRYGWCALASLHDELMNQHLIAELVSPRPLTALDLIEAGKTSFYTRAELSKSDLEKLSEKDRRRALNPSVSDFCRLIRLERELKRDLKSSK
jgi:hypothetical protein